MIHLNPNPNYSLNVNMNINLYDVYDYDYLISNYNNFISSLMLILYFLNISYYLF